MKVAFVIQKLGALRGGAERVLCELASALAARGWQVEVLTYERSGEDAAYPLTGVRHLNLFPFPKPPSGLRQSARLERQVGKIPNVAPFTHLKWAMTHGAFISRLTAHLRRSRPNVVIGFMPPGIVAATRAARSLGLPCIASTHNVPEEDFGAGARWDDNPIFRRARGQALADASRILVLSPDFVDWFDAKLHRKTQVMPNPVMQGPDPAAYQKTRAPHIIGVGRLVPIKRFEVLIRAFARLASVHPDWQLQIFGEGPEKDRLNALIETSGLRARARLCGATEQIGEIYGSASLLAHPAEFEGFGLSVAEALSHGLPVVADANCPGVNRLVKDGTSGRLIEMDSAGIALAETLDGLIRNPEMRAQMGSAGHAAMKVYEMAKIVQLWEDLLQEVCAPA